MSEDQTKRVFTNEAGAVNVFDFSPKEVESDAKAAQFLTAFLGIEIMPEQIPDIRELIAISMR